MILLKNLKIFKRKIKFLKKLNQCLQKRNLLQKVKNQALIRLLKARAQKIKKKFKKILMQKLKRNQEKLMRINNPAKKREASRSLIKKQAVFPPKNL
jgi:hypothetical protein